MTDVPLRIYWDVDGVFVTYFERLRGKKRDVLYQNLLEDSGYGRHFNTSVATDGKYWVVMSRDLLDAVQGVTDNYPHVEHVWLTSWQTYASTVLSHRVQFRAGATWRAITWPMTTPEGERYPYWKTDALAADLEGFDGKALWIDDELTAFSTSGRLNELLEKTGDRLRLLPTHEPIGLTKKHMCGIIEFVSTESSV